MAFTIPNYATASFAGQAVTDSTDVQAQILALDGTYVVSGCAVTWSSGRTLAVAAGTVAVNGTVHAVSATTVTVTAGSSTGDRRDIVTVSSSGVVSVTKGSPCTTTGWLPTSPGAPVKPAIPATHVILAEVYVTGSASTLSSSCLVDKRVNVATPTFAGDVTGSARSTTVGKIQGKTVTPATPTGNQVLTYTASGSKWLPRTRTTSSAGGTITVTGGTTNPTLAVAKVPTSAVVAGTHIAITTSGGKAEISATGLAPTASPTFTGTVNAAGASEVLVPEAATGDNSTKAASTSFVTRMFQSVLLTTGLTSNFGTGSHDNATAIQTALNSHDLVVLPPGMYGIKSTLQLKGHALKGATMGNPKLSSAPSSTNFVGTGLCPMTGGTYTNRALVTFTTTKTGATLRDIAIAPGGTTTQTSTTLPLAVWLNCNGWRMRNVLVNGAVVGVYGAVPTVVGTTTTYHSQGGAAVDLNVFAGKYGGRQVAKSSTTHSAGATTIKLKTVTIANIHVGMVMLNRSRYAANPASVVIAVTATNNIVTLLTSCKVHATDVLDFWGAIAWLLPSPDCTTVQCHSSAAVPLIVAGDTRCNSGHHSASSGTGGASLIHRHTQRCAHTGCTTDGTTGLVYRYRGNVNFEGGNAQAAGSAKKAFILDQGTDTTHGAHLRGIGTVGVGGATAVFAALISYTNKPTGGAQSAGTRPDTIVGCELETGSMVLTTGKATLTTGNPTAQAKANWYAGVPLPEHPIAPVGTIWVKSASISPSATKTTYGTAVAVTPDANFTGVYLGNYNVITTGVSSETVHVKMKFTYTTGSHNTISTSITSSTTSTPSFFSALTDGKVIAKITFSMESSKTSSTAAATVNVAGLNVR